MRSILLLAAATLAACTVPDSNTANDLGETEQSGPMAPGNDMAAGEPIQQEPGAEPTANRAGPMLPEADADECGAREYQYLVGKPRSRVPAQPAGANWRVTCTSCPVTMDYSPARLNILYDEESEIVEKVSCG